MVVFGAGASHDVDPTQSRASRPALSNELFSAIYRDSQRRWPDFRGILKELSIASQPPEDGGSTAALEDVLQGYQSEADDRGDEDRQIQLASVRFYLRELSRQWSGSGIGSLDNNYVSMLDKVNHRQALRESPVALVSFNYDTLLESALQVIMHTTSAEGEPRLMAVTEYAQVDVPYVILKPHGSWHWGIEVVDHSAIKGEPITPTDLIRAAPRLGFGTRYAVVSNHLEVVRPTDGMVLFPSIALPVRSKDFAWPVDHGAVLDACIAKVTHLITIGWRAQEDHFLSRWVATRPELRGIQIVTQSEQGANEVEERLHAAGLESRNIEKFAGGFTGYNAYLRRVALDDFLSH